MTPDKPRILVVDDDPQMRTFLIQALSSTGAEVVAAEDGEEGIGLYADQAFDLVLLDFQMPKMDGIEVLRQLKDRDREVTAIMMTGYGSIDSAVQAMKAGAVDYLTKPLDVDHLEIVLLKALKGREQAEKLRVLEDQVAHQGSFEGLIGVSPNMRRVYRLIDRLAGSDATVLIQGETGTGKELAARAIHNRSRRCAQRFIPINCGALSETILESELFGHEKGAFTGAVRRKYGLIEQAEGGTLFLDEIEEMSPALQVKLLRAIQEREIMPVGGERTIRVDFRLVAASNADLRGLMGEGKFRSDLFYRLSVANLELPPLRARREDIPLLANHFLANYVSEGERHVNGIAPEAMMLLKSYDWPGNVRELENVMLQAMLFCEGEAITVEDLPESVADAKPGTGGSEWFELPLQDARKHFERRYLEEMLARADGRVADAAKMAGIRRQRFYEKMKDYGISREQMSGF